MTDEHGRFRICKTGFDSSARYLLKKRMTNFRMTNKSRSPFDIRHSVIRHYYCPRGVPDTHATLRRSKTRFDSWTGYLRLASVTDEHGRLRICKTGFDSSARYLNEFNVLGVCRIRTRPREGRGPGPIPGEDTYTTLEPDGSAAACKAVRSRFDSCQRL